MNRALYLAILDRLRLIPGLTTDEVQLVDLPPDVDPLLSPPVGLERYVIERPDAAQLDRTTVYPVSAHGRDAGL
jgi:hypothetical protein